MRLLVPSRLSPLGSKAITPQLCIYPRLTRSLHFRPPTYTVNGPSQPNLPKQTTEPKNLYKSMATAIPERYKLVFYVPHSDLEKCKEAIFATGGGAFPGAKYTKVCFQSPGTGQFLPGDGATPAIGATGTLEKVEEMRVEIMCVGRSIMLQAVQALVQAHPYEEVAYEVYKMENV